MRILKTILTVMIAALTIAAVSVTAFAADYTTPAEAVAGLTGRTVEDVIAERVETGKTYGTIAKDAEKLSSFQEACLAMKTDTINEQVVNGTISQTEADEIVAAITAYQAANNGTGTTNGNYGVGYCVGGADCIGYGYHNHHTTTSTDNNYGTGYYGTGYGYGGGHHGGGHRSGGHGCW